MEEIRHYKKYAGKSAEEILRMQREREKRSREKMTIEMKEKIKEKYKDKNVGRCEICGKEYRNIYVHNNTKGHKKREEEK